MKNLKLNFSQWKIISHKRLLILKLNYGIIITLFWGLVTLRKHSQLQEHSHSPISDDSVANITLSVTLEQKVKVKCQFNIVLHNLKESDATDSATRKQEDIESCCSLFLTYLNVSASIKTAIRLGKKDSRPCRLLKLTLSSLDEKAKFLNAS